MADESIGDRSPALAPVFAAVNDPDRGRRLLPRLLALLDDTDESHRLGACWAICYVLATHPAVAPYLVTRLLDRLEDDPPLSVELLATYVWTRFPEQVDEAIRERRAERDDYEPPALSGPAARTGPRRSGSQNRPVGRTRLAGDGTDPGPQQVYSDDEERQTEAQRAAARGGDDADDAASEESEGDGADERDPLAPESVAEGYEPPELLSLITRRSVFDSLSAVAGRTRTRYADIYRTLAVRDGDEVGVGLALFHRPAADQSRFARELDGALDRWHSVADHDNVVTLYDWHAEPRPWATPEYTDLTLADRGRLPPALAHWNARSLADALAHVHENGVVHGGIDPGNVAYYGNVLADDERQPPMLTNVGLPQVIRQYFDPTTRLDPRYAAPEYFDRRYGQIDHATDIYHLGAICYRLFTGEPPFDGDYETVRQAILEGERPAPSDAADVPPAIDDVVTKAMATEKLRRYESVSHLRAELRAMGASPDG